MCIGFELTCVDAYGGAVAHSSFPLVQGEGRDGVLLYALIVKTE